MKHPANSQLNYPGPIPGEIDFEQLIDSYGESLYRFIYRCTGQSDLAFELTVETFEAASQDYPAFSNLSRYRQAGRDEYSDNNTLAVWLYTWAYQILLETPNWRKISKQDAYAALKTYRRGLKELLNRSANQYKGQISLLEKIDRTNRSKLTSLFLQVEGFTYQEIAEITGLTLAEVSLQIFQAREILAIL